MERLRLAPLETQNALNVSELVVSSHSVGKILVRVRGPVEARRNSLIGKVFICLL